MGQWISVTEAVGSDWQCRGSSTAPADPCACFCNKFLHRSDPRSNCTYSIGDWPGNHFCRGEYDAAPHKGSYWTFKCKISGKPISCSREAGYYFNQKAGDASQSPDHKDHRKLPLPDGITIPSVVRVLQSVPV